MEQERKKEDLEKIVIILSEGRAGTSRVECLTALERGTTPVEVYGSEAEYHRHQIKNTKLDEFTRKSIVGAAYRVGASFAMDAMYLTAAGALGYYLAEKRDAADSAFRVVSDFIHHLEPWKLARVAAAVVAINFADYKLSITDRLDSLTKKTMRKLKGGKNEF